ncbi:unnamed protein product [Tilletia controversa]|uniref:NmrA-like domain-containing protein n=3 Tax=Tilletia TaxID=13289 RepID=A0A8X7MWI1_9BASI|nr:hypothetical protein CF336_g2426 [Tilletia laevis]KAE8202071.1 hypothetical protein CF328_g2430 [Tilletia controversa]KAE8262928.1 hypothetical protein A4X03_0g2067 [Tilletia caries]KAE8206520.1 hypothetical protein CF335_g1825 [Tilletia laevis]KAE8250933.1 hypothetical protein A4X06_0g2881 [Tilletia controversa]
MDVYPYYTSYAFVGVGDFGERLVREFLDPASVHKISRVSIITRHSPDTYARLYQQKAEIVGDVDYDDQDALVAALYGHQVVVSTFSNCIAVEAAVNQRAFILAAKRAGVQLFVLSEFGIEFDLSRCPPGQGPTFQILKNQARALAEEIGLPWLSIQAGLFDIFLCLPEFVLDADACIARILGNGDRRFPISAQSDVASFTHAALTSGRLSPTALHYTSLRTQSAFLSWIEIVEAMEIEHGRPWTIRNGCVDEARAWVAEGVNLDDGRLGAWFQLEIEVGALENGENDNARVGFVPRVRVEDMF